MGSLIYDFLTESFLFSEPDIASEYSKLTDNEIEKELSRYRQFVLDNFSKLSAEITSSSSNLRVFHAEKGTTVSLLKQTALYVEQFVVVDPLFALVRPENKIGAVMNQYLGFQTQGLDRQKLLSVVKFLKDITPMVAGDFVKLLPTSFFFEPPSEIPIYYSENDYEEGLPKPVLDYFKQRAKVSSLERADGGWFTRGELYPSRGITVEFPGYFGGRIYYLFEQEILNHREENGRMLAEFRQHLPKEPPNDAQFDIWVKQSINRASKSVFDETIRDLIFATSHSSMFMTSSEFKADLLNANFRIEDSIQSDVVNALFELELPFLEKISAESIMSVRQNDGQAFQNLRTELEKQLRELRLVKDPEQLRVKKRNLVHELTEVQVRQVGQKVNQLKKKAFADSLLMIGGLAGSVQTGGWSLLASTAAMLKGYQTVQDYYQNTRQNPAFFMWKILKK